MSNSRTALIVAAALVLAVLPATAAPTGVTAPATDGLSDSAGIQQQAAADVVLRSGATVWQGQQLAVDTSNLDADSLAVWRVTEDGQLNRQITSVSTDGNGTAVVDTSSLDGRYLLRVGESPVYVNDGTAYTSNPPDGTRVTRAASTFRVATQTLSTSWSDPSVYPGQEVTLTVESNRGSSVVAVSGGNLSFQGLTTLLPAEAYAEDYDARKNDSALLLEVEQSTSLRLNTTPLQPGEGDFTLDVVDTTARTTPSLTVLEPGESHITALERSEHVGDVVDVHLKCQHCFLVVGGPGQGLIDVVEVRDSSGDGNVTVRINTRYAGIGRGQSDFPNDVNAYTSPEDSVRRYSSSENLDTTSDELLTTTVGLSDLRSELGVAPNGRQTPLEAGQIRLTVASSDYLLSRSDHGDRPPLGTQLVAADETDVAIVELHPRSLDGMEAMAAPPESSDSIDKLRANVGPRERVALGDRLVFRVDVSGIYGYLAAHGDTLENVRANEDEGIELRVHRSADEDGSTPEPLNLGQTTARILADPANDHLYLVMETGGTGRRQLGAGKYGASFELEGVSEGSDGYSAATTSNGFPYLEPGETTRASAGTTVSEPVGSIRRPAEGAGPNVTTAGALSVSGATSVAPGATVTVLASATDYAWETTTKTEVEASGNWSAELGLSEAPGQTFDVTLSRDGTTLDTKTYTVYPPAKNASGNASGSGGSGSNSGGGGAQAAVAGGGPTIPILGIQLPGLGGLADLAVPIGGGVGALAVVWLGWKLVIKRLLL